MSYLSSQIGQRPKTALTSLPVSRESKEIFLCVLQFYLKLFKPRQIFQKQVKSLPTWGGKVSKGGGVLTGKLYFLSKLLLWCRGVSWNFTRRHTFCSFFRQKTLIYLCTKRKKLYTLCKNSHSGTVGIFLKVWLKPHFLLFFETKYTKKNCSRSLSKLSLWYLVQRGFADFCF